MKLTKAQQRALDKMSVGQSYSAYELSESLATLDALVKKGCLKRRVRGPYIFSPRTEIQYTRQQSQEEAI